LTLGFRTVAIMMIESLIINIRLLNIVRLTNMNVWPDQNGHGI